jgi:hypothetical protein
MKTLGSFKRGDTFAFYADLKDKSTGDIIDIDASLVASQVRNANGKLFAELSVTKHATIPGRYLFQTTAAVTSLWPASMDGVLLYIDIAFIVDSVTSSTETFSVNVLTDITYEEVT